MSDIFRDIIELEQILKGYDSEDEYANQMKDLVSSIKKGMEAFE